MPRGNKGRASVRVVSHKKKVRRSKQTDLSSYKLYPEEMKLIESLEEEFNSSDAVNAVALFDKIGSVLYHGNTSVLAFTKERCQKNSLLSVLRERLVSLRKNIALFINPRYLGNGDETPISKVLLLF